MSSNDHEPQFTKKRSLSRFLAQELLYDYVTDQLDEQRREAVKEFLESDSDLKEECNSIEQAIEYCQSLSSVEVSEPVLRRHVEKKNLTASLLEVIGWKAWPDYVKWTFESVFVVGLVVSIAVWIPWEQINLFEKESKTLVKNNDQTETQQMIGEEEPFDDELDIKIAEKNEKVIKDIKDKKEMKKLAAKQKEEKAREIEKTRIAKLKEEKEKAAIVQKDFSKKEIVKPAPVGNPFVYRGTMEASDLDVITPQLVNKIKALSGEKAGRVELGWRKPNASYFHFKMPEKHYEEVVQFFRQYGTLQLEKTPHRRVMPAGRIRFIIEIKDSNMNP